MRNTSRTGNRAASWRAEPGQKTMTASTSSSARPLLLAIATVTCVEFLENGLVIFAASQIMAGLQLRPEEFALSYTLYGVASIFMLYKHQWMVERFGYRRFILASLACFALGAILAATADGVGQFVLGRLLQGASGATFFTAGRMEMNRLPIEARFAGLLCFIGSLLGASAIAPLGAAALLGLWGWRAIFWAVVPLCLAIAVVAGPQLSTTTAAPGERSEEHWGWLLWLVLGIFGLQYTIQEIPGDIASSRGLLFAIGLASIAALSLFAWRQWQKDRPLINYRGLLQWRYLLGISLYFSGYFMIGASGFLLPIFFREGLGLPLTTSALVLSAGMAASVGAAIWHAAAARHNPRLRQFMLSGLVLFALGCFAFSQVGRLDDWRWLLLPTLLLGVAIPVFIGPVAFSTFTELPPAVFSHGYQVKNIVRQLGISSSIALSTAALQFFYAGQLKLQPEGMHPGWAQALHGLSGVNGGLISPLTLAGGEVFFWLGLAMLPVVLLVALQRIIR